VIAVIAVIAVFWAIEMVFFPGPSKTEIRPSYLFVNIVVADATMKIEHRVTRGRAIDFALGESVLPSFDDNNRFWQKPPFLARLVHNALAGIVWKFSSCYGVRCNIDAGRPLPVIRRSLPIIMKHAGNMGFLPDAKIIDRIIDRYGYISPQLSDFGVARNANLAQGNYKNSESYNGINADANRDATLQSILVFIVDFVLIAIFFKFFSDGFDMSIQRGQLLGDIYMIVGWLSGAAAVCIFIFWFIGHSSALPFTENAAVSSKIGVTPAGH
jgi:hypothetical protein